MTLAARVTSEAAFGTRRLLLSCVLMLPLAVSGCGRSMPSDPHETAPPPLANEAEPSTRAAGRYAAPDWLPCAPEQVTSYMGDVSSYARTAREIRVDIRTDWDTQETVTLSAAGGYEPRLRLDGEPFDAADWNTIETSPGKLRAPMRVHAWVCRDGSTILDWRPPASR